MDLCDNCGKNPANEPSTCPFSEELEECNCCDDCRFEYLSNI